MEKIDSFREKWRFLSNFAQTEVVMDGKKYTSVEHAYQAAKFPTGSEIRGFVGTAPYPGAAKKMARKYHHLQDKGFYGRRLEVMEDLVRQKFTNHPIMRKDLLDTGDAELIEGNTWGDDFWGTFRGKGENNLGKILMKIRGELRCLKK